MLCLNFPIINLQASQSHSPFVFTGIQDCYRLLAVARSRSGKNNAPCYFLIPSRRFVTRETPPRLWFWSFEGDRTLQEPMDRSTYHTIKISINYNILTNRRIYDTIYTHGALAQLGAHDTGSVGVRGSSPLCSTKNNLNHSLAVWSRLFLL